LVGHRKKYPRQKHKLQFLTNYMEESFSWGARSFSGSASLPSSYESASNPSPELNKFSTCHMIFEQQFAQRNESIKDYTFLFLWNPLQKLFSDQYLGLPSVLFTSHLMAKTVYVFPLSPMHASSFFASSP
jgi:hypothetical protein